MSQHDDVANTVAGVASLCFRYGSYDSQYFGWSPEADKPQQPAAPAAPQPVQCNGDWWRSQPQYQQPSQATYIESADENLRRMYKALNGFR